MNDETNIKPEPTYGQRMVGTRFNPSELTDVDTTKQAFADVIDLLIAQVEDGDDPDQDNIVSVAITHIMTAQMWAVKALTWEG